MRDMSLMTPLVVETRVGVRVETLEERWRNVRKVVEIRPFHSTTLQMDMGSRVGSFIFFFSLSQTHEPLERIQGQIYALVFSSRNAKILSKGFDDTCAFRTG